MKAKHTLLQRAAAVVLSVFTTVSVLLPVHAKSFKYSGVEPPQTVSFQKYLVLDLDATVPNVSFSYTIKPGDAIPGDADHFSVFPGTFADKIRVGDADHDYASISFSSESPTTSFVEDGDDLVLANGKAYAKKTVTVNFFIGWDDFIEWKEPGVYRYIISETASTAPGIINDPVTDRTLDFYVRDNGSGKLEVAQTVLHTGTDAPLRALDKNEGYRLDTKSTGYTNQYESYALSFCKSVVGNQASRDKYFKFLLKVEGDVPGSSHRVDLSQASTVPVKNSATKYENMSNPSLIISDEDGNLSAEFYLQNGDTICIPSLPAGCKWTVSENAEDYESSAKLEAADNGDNIVISESGDEVSDPSFSGDANLLFTNGKQGAVPTGISLNGLPYLTLGLITCTAAYLIYKRKRA